MKKVLFVVSIVMLLLVVMAIPAFAAPAVKVDVCHSTSSETNEWVKINVSENAFAAHVEHGDAGPGDDVPDVPGYSFDDSCNPEPSGPPAVCYDNYTGDFDITYSGTLDVLGNIVAHSSRDGSCDGDVFATGTLVIANSPAEASALCDAVGGAFTGFTWADLGWSDLPANAWACIP